jgi:hypothetical protein
MQCSEIRGFNYDGSWGTSGLDVWQHHDYGLMAAEIARGKRYFPKWNIARWWMSDEAFYRNPERYLANFEGGLGIFAEHDIRVVPVLFNRWRDPVCDFGGVPLDHIIPGFSNMTDGIMDLWAYPDGDAPRSLARPEVQYTNYLTAMITAHAGDPRIFAWDLCNEPLMGPYVRDPHDPITVAELRWLTWCYRLCKRLGATQPLTIGNFGSLDALRLTAPISDILSFHPYYIWNRPGQSDATIRADLIRFLDECVAFAESVGKPLYASETVWGAHDDAQHVEVMRFNLGELVKRGIGFTVHALQHSLIADLHWAEYGPVGWPQELHFVNPDGSLRAGHAAFNDFC